MSTNYYWVQGACGACGHTPEPQHIGKSSAGWRFLMRVYPEHGIHTLSDWQQAWASGEGHIEDEYGRVVRPRTMEDVIDAACEGFPHEHVWARNGPLCDYTEKEFS